MMDHYRNPHNYGTIENATNRITEYNPICGDTVHLEMIINEGRIEDIKFVGRGCSISQASASILTETVKGKSISSLNDLTDQKYLMDLGVSLGPARERCALLSLNALRKAIAGDGTAP
jgi:nitrogen fixation NifU-like protein